jgi:hypothetical protein
MAQGSGEPIDDRAPESELSGIGARAKRLALVSAISVTTVNVWTGSPLLALWVGSQVQGSGPPSMAAVGAVAGTLAVVSLVLVKLLSVMSDRYDKLVGRPRGPREPAPWLRSLRGERSEERTQRLGLTAPERILVLTVVVAVAAFEVWFFFFSGSPFGGPSGR